MSSELDIRNLTKGKPPRLPFADMKQRILGGSYDLSLTFIGDTRSRTLNRTYRGKDKIANVLSFPFDSQTGEILINLREAKRQATNYDTTYTKFVARLFIHACVHLKGYDHGSKMDRIEKTWQKTFAV